MFFEDSHQSQTDAFHLLNDFSHVLILYRRPASVAAELPCGIALRWPTTSSIRKRCRLRTVAFFLIRNTFRIVDAVWMEALNERLRQAASFGYCRSNSISEYGCLMNRSEEECCGQPCSYHEVRQMAALPSRGYVTEQTQHKSMARGCEPRHFFIAT